MSHRLRWYVPNTVYEVTNRTIQERYLLKPSEESRALLIGVLATALRIFTSVRLHAFVFLSNHCHLLISAVDSEQLAPFLGFVFGNSSKEMGRLHEWRGSLWGKPCSVIPILDEEAQINRLRYLLANGVKEGLVESPRDWPGATAIHGLLGDMRVAGRWIERDRYRRALRSRKRKPTTIEEFTKDVTVELQPLPCWSDLDAAQLRARHEDLVCSIERRGELRSALYLGVTKLLATSAHDRPESSTHDPAPFCHATSGRAVELFRPLYRDFVQSFRAMTKGLVERPPSSAPRGSFPRPNWYSRPSQADSFGCIASIG